MRRHLLASIVMLVGVTIVLGFVYPLVVTGISMLFFRHQAEGSLVYRHGKLVGSSLLGQNFTTSKGSPLPQYFQPRPSAAGTGYNGASSGATNLGPSNPLLIGFVPAVNAVSLSGKPSKVNPFATKADPNCVPVDPKGNPVPSPTAGQKYATNPDGSYICDPNTVPERAIAYRQFNRLPAGVPIPIDAITDSGSGLDAAISIQNALDQAPRVARARHLAPGTVLALVHDHTQDREWGFLGEPTVNVLELNLALDQLR
jgi:potassium-transporting ATPase KdpC subunit